MHHLKGIYCQRYAAYKKYILSTKIYIYIYIYSLKEKDGKVIHANTYQINSQLAVLQK